MTSRGTLGNEIRVQDLSVWRSGNGRSVEALSRVNLVIAPGELATILGPSGCGKSTLLGAIGGFVAPSSGTVLIDGRPVRGPDGELGMVFQQHSLFPWLSVIDNVAFGLKMAGAKVKERKRDALAMLKLVGLTEFEDCYPAQLSGGMQHRAEIARVLVKRPRVLLMDEPFGALDAQTRGSMQDLLLEIWSKLKTTVVFVTHDVDEAILLGDRVITMTARPGRIGWERNIRIERPRSRDLFSSPQFLEIKREYSQWIRSGTGHPAEACAARRAPEHGTFALSLELPK